MVEPSSELYCVSLQRRICNPFDGKHFRGFPGDIVGMRLVQFTSNPTIVDVNQKSKGIMTDSGKIVYILS